MAIKFKITNGTYSAEGTSATIKCNGKKMLDDLVIEAVEVADVALISFTINGTSYQAIDGWTWGEWVADTKYNTAGYFLTETDFVQSIIDTPVYDTNGERVNSSYSILVNGVYYHSNNHGGGSN